MQDKDQRHAYTSYMTTKPEKPVQSEFDQPYPLTDAQIQSYRRDGFIQLDGMITRQMLESFRGAVSGAVTELEHKRRATDPNKVKGTYEQIFIQKVNLWRQFPEVQAFTLAPRFADVAARLMGGPVRVWHDQALFKEPHTGAKTPWHQDAPYWPHQKRDKQLTIWIALKDATLRNGCLSFLPGTQTINNVESIDLGDPQDIFKLDPSLGDVKPIACELEAGSCTFHHGMTFHYAGPNKSDGMREAFAIIYMPADTTFSGAEHMVTQGQNHQVGDTLAGELFPLVRTGAPVP